MAGRGEYDLSLSSEQSHGFHDSVRGSTRVLDLEKKARVSSERTMRSPYMEWAKLHSEAPFNLASSGVQSYPLAELPVKLEQLEINGSTVYGYAPLQERLAKKAGVTPECVVAAQGTSMANHLAMAALIAPGDEVLIEDPTYELLLSAARY